MPTLLLWAVIFLIGAVATREDMKRGYTPGGDGWF